ncbi:hypothetical protein GTP41_06670 [Pseudoduganella sp. DS3]|uniref:Uncharacterized protein n=1 Tax=Pseudoduganella guangdongensis TaxID=2692179 RepID=A0A6N9HED6_9BURK|nr:hypothetical protein [Pseudoduganella guangdongensis]MYN01780.1 hypothetical protein [Pseudoduganella guangdongensis]
MKLTPIGPIVAQDLKDSARATGKSFGSYLAQELENYMKLTPAERIREAVLKKLGLTEADLASMPPSARQGIEDKIGEMVKAMMAESTPKTRDDSSPPRV